MKFNLTPEEVECIEEWLKYDRSDASYRCPFEVKASDGDTKCKRICFRIFPLLKKPRCPCGQFGDLYVRQVAEKIIKEYNKEEKSWPKIRKKSCLDIVSTAKKNEK